MLEHSLEAQNPIYEQVLNELRNGHKQTHWMCFIFPQPKGLGTSPVSIRYAIEHEKQAGEYWNHPILGQRLRECFALVESSVKTTEQIFSPNDAPKYLSCRDLFSQFISQRSTQSLLHPSTADLMSSLLGRFIDLSHIVESD